MRMYCNETERCTKARLVRQLAEVQDTIEQSRRQRQYSRRLRNIVRIQRICRANDRWIAYIKQRYSF